MYIHIRSRLNSVGLAQACTYMYVRMYSTQGIIHVTGLAVQFAMRCVHDSYSILSGVAAFSIAMCHWVALRLENC